jgi:hypothetical protein
MSNTFSSVSLGRPVAILTAVCLAALALPLSFSAGALAGRPTAARPLSSPADRASAGTSREGSAPRPPAPQISRFVRYLAAIELQSTIDRSCESRHWMEQARHSLSIDPDSIDQQVGITDPRTDGSALAFVSADDDDHFVTLEELLQLDIFKSDYKVNEKSLPDFVKDPLYAKLCKPVFKYTKAYLCPNSKVLSTKVET